MYIEVEWKRERFSLGRDDENERDHFFLEELVFI